MRIQNPYTSCPQNPYPPISPCPANGQVLAMAYVPWQTWKSLYDGDTALQKGTIFQELQKPFQGMGGCCA